MRVKRESEVTQSCLTLSDPMDCSLPGSSIHGICHAGVLEWVAIAFSKSSVQLAFKHCPLWLLSAGMNCTRSSYSIENSLNRYVEKYCRALGLRDYLGICTHVSRGLPRWHSGKEMRLLMQETRVQSRIGKIPWRRKWQPTAVFLPGKSQGQRSLVDHSPWGRKESDTTEHARAHTHQGRWGALWFETGCKIWVALNLLKESPRIRGLFMVLLDAGGKCGVGFLLRCPVAQMLPSSFSFLFRQMKMWLRLWRSSILDLVNGTGSPGV